MDIYFFIKGFVIGFSIAAPVGPIGILCIQRTLAGGLAAGLVSGLGAATADGFYGVVAAFGLKMISDLLTGQQFWFRLIGGIYLLYLGAGTIFARLSDKELAAGNRGLAGNYLSTLFLTATNPMTILSFAAIFAGIGLAGPKGDYLSAFLMVAGVVAGSALWWLVLSSGVSLFRAKFDAKARKMVNIVSGTVIVVFALMALGSIIG